MGRPGSRPDGGFRPDAAFWSMSQVLGAIFVAVVMAYAFQGLVPIFNNDDVRQVQSPEVLAMVTQGRWLYYFLFHKVSGQSPLPGLSTFVGSACLVWAAWFHAKLIGIKHPSSVLVLGLVSSISIYYGHMFEFDSTRMAYPLGNLASAFGLLMVHQATTIRSRFAGIFLLSLGPALYPSTVMYQVTLLLTAALYWVMLSDTSQALRGVAKAFLSIVAGVVVYRVMTIALYAVVGLELDDRGALNGRGLVDNWDTIRQIIARNAVPFLDPGGTAPYFPPAYSYAVLAIFVLFFVVLFATGENRLSLPQLGLVCGGFIALLFSPFFLVAFTETDYYPIRSLYSFAAVYGALLAIAFERLASGQPIPLLSGRLHWLSGAVLVVAATFAFTNASLIGQKSYDQSLAWQSDVAQVNRIIYRIDELIAEAPELATKDPSARIPIVVVGEAHWRSGPRGFGVNSWQHPWSKDYIFSLLDNRFVPGSEPQQQRAIEVARDRAVWPSSESVFIDGDMVVVVR